MTAYNMGITEKVKITIMKITVMELNTEINIAMEKDVEMVIAMSETMTETNSNLTFAKESKRERTKN
ncbi:hypothetical protein [Flavobacterium caseinilyticum]|uniref:hypothetical protein n=1 Tax=Flavobacterium caseinilyticum TaxID=2541732 RepID=UPI0014046450|nr:hypothetical protein [Flavobacterium caseinilyticum]